jgi:signal transduction histidine kinase
VERVRESLKYLLAVVGLVDAGAADQGVLAEARRLVVEEAKAVGVDIVQVAGELVKMSPKRAMSLLSVESMMEDLQIAEKSANTILAIKEDLIGPARQRKPTAVSLPVMIAEMVANMGLPQGVVTTEFAADLPDVAVDARQVEQVFNNLVKNAWEALHDTGLPRIWVRVQRDENPKFVLVTVMDNGPGIPKEIQEKIWVSFFTTKGGRGGTGLGLSACVQIVNQNGGKIWLESEPRKGAAFYVLLPAAE